MVVFLLFRRNHNNTKGKPTITWSLSSNAIEIYQLKWKLQASEHPELVPIEEINKKV